jgi:hypothetical protein
VSLLPLPSTYRNLAIAGWLAYAISWVTPAGDSAHIGAWAFTATPSFVLSLISTGTLWGVAIAICLLLGWLANFSILMLWPVGARAAWIVAPWLPFAITQLWMQSHPHVLYFYPWAAGIAAIHGAHIAAGRDTTPTDSPQ